MIASPTVYDADRVLRKLIDAELRRVRQSLSASEAQHRRVVVQYCNTSRAARTARGRITRLRSQERLLRDVRVKLFVAMEAARKAGVR